MYVIVRNDGLIAAPIHPAATPNKGYIDICTDCFRLKPGIPVTTNSPFHMGDRNKGVALSGKVATVHDFWKWAFSLLNENTTRGILAQYIVAWALGADRCHYSPWNPYDLRISTGKKIEVKATATAQIWEHGEENRKPQFVITEKAYYTHEHGLDRKNVDFHADIYVLCYYNHEDSTTADALNLSHWEFWVFTKRELIRSFGVVQENKEEKRRVRVSIAQLRKIKQKHQSVNIEKLRDTVYSL